MTPQEVNEAAELLKQLSNLDVILAYSKGDDLNSLSVTYRKDTTKTSETVSLYNLEAHSMIHSSLELLRLETIDKLKSLGVKVDD